MLQSRVPFWAFAVIGMSLVIFLYGYVTAKFAETDAYDQEIYTSSELDSVQSASNVTRAEQLKVDAWISANGLNQYGDPKDTVYAGGNPLFNERTGNTMSRYEYIRSKHPQKPWNSSTASGE